MPPYVPFTYSDPFLEFAEERSANLHKLRLRGLFRETIHVHPRYQALEYFNRLDANVIDSDIIECFPDESWTRDWEWDIVIEFRTLGKRFEVYERRTDVASGLYTVCDELGPERVDIWKSLARMHDDYSIYTSLGKVILYLDKKQYVFMYMKHVELYSQDPTEYKYYSVAIPPGGY